MLTRLQIAVWKEKAARDTDFAQALVPLLLGKLEALEAEVARLRAERSESDGAEVIPLTPAGH